VLIEKRDGCSDPDEAAFLGRYPLSGGVAKILTFYYAADGFNVVTAGGIVR